MQTTAHLRRFHDHRLHRLNVAPSHLPSPIHPDILGITKFAYILSFLIFRFALTPQRITTPKCKGGDADDGVAVPFPLRLLFVVQLQEGAEQGVLRLRRRLGHRPKQSAAGKRRGCVNTKYEIGS